MLFIFNNVDIDESIIAKTVNVTGRETHRSELIPSIPTNKKTEMISVDGKDKLTTGLKSFSSKKIVKYTHDTNKSKNILLPKTGFKNNLSYVVLGFIMLMALIFVPVRKIVKRK